MSHSSGSLEKLIFSIMLIVIYSLVGASYARGQQRSDITPEERKEIRLAGAACLECNDPVKKVFETTAKFARNAVVSKAFKKAVLWVSGSATVATSAGVALNLLSATETASPEIDMRPPANPPPVYVPQRGVEVKVYNYPCYKDGKQVPCPPQ